MIIVICLFKQNMNTSYFFESLCGCDWVSIQLYLLERSKPDTYVTVTKMKTQRCPSWHLDSDNTTMEGERMIREKLPPQKKKKKILLSPASQYKRTICDVFYRNQTHLGKKSSWLFIMKVEIFSFTMIAFRVLAGIFQNCGGFIFGE